MRIAVLAPGYPSDAVPYNYAFVHARCQLYAARDEIVAAFALGTTDAYELDGVSVTVAARDPLRRAIQEFRPDVLAIHAPNFRTIPIARSLRCPQVSWVHGHEALFNLSSVEYGRTRMQRAAKWAKVIPRNLVQLATLRRFLTAQSRIVFVSRWIHHAAERHTLQRYPNALVIPNPVDTDLFTYRLDTANRCRGITARSLSSTKYGIDVAIRAFTGNDGATLDIVGRGSLETRYRRLINRLGANARLLTNWFPHRDMPDLFADYGFFVAPSRAETQGVTMCEAMACGLPVIASRVGGIPEYVSHDVEGLLVPPNDPAALRAAVDRLISDPKRYEALSLAARRRVETQCSHTVVAEQELSLLRGA